MQVPDRIQPQKLADYLEIMSKAVFQTGISWKVVNNKWDDIRTAMREFDPEALAHLTPTELDDLTQDTRVIRNRRKLEGIVHNARTILDLADDHKTFQNYLRSYAAYTDLAKDLRKRFKFLGDVGIYYFLWVVGEEIPPYEEVFGHPPPGHQS